MDTNLTQNEKISRMVTGLETDAKTVVMNDGAFAKEKAAIFNDAVEDQINKLDEHFKKVSQNYEKLGEANLEIFPIGNNILVKPYPENIFQRVVKSDSGIIVDLGGLAPTYKSHEDGHVHEEESFISVGLVIEVGPETKWVKPDDIIMWTKPSEVPVPFYKQGLRMVNENRIIVTINKDLHERFNGNG